MRLAAAANPREYTNPGVPKPWAITRALEPMQIAANEASVAIRSHGTQRAGILATARYNDAITTTCRHDAATNCHSIAGSCRNAVSGNILMISRMVFGRRHHLSHTSQASTATAMPHANPVRRRSWRRASDAALGDERRFSHRRLLRRRIRYIAHCEGAVAANRRQTSYERADFSREGAAICVSGVDFVFAKRLSTFRGVAKTRCPGIERQSPLESCGFGVLILGHQPSKRR